MRDTPTPPRRMKFNSSARLDSSRVRDVTDSTYSVSQQSYLDFLDNRKPSSDIELGALGDMPLYFAGNPSPTPSATLSLNDIAAQYGMGPVATGSARTSTSTKKVDDPNILWDTTHTTYNPKTDDVDTRVESRKSPRKVAVAINKTRSSLLNQFDHMSQDEQRKIAGFLTIAGYLSTEADTTFQEMNDRAILTPLGKVREKYAELLDEAYTMQQPPYGQPITPMQLLKQRIAYRLAAAGIQWKGDLDHLGKLTGMTILGGNEPEDEKSGKSESPRANQTFTTTHTTRDIMDPEDAKGLTRAMLQQELGRDPTEAEYEDFVAMLQHAQRADPSKTTTRSTYDANGYLLNESSTTHQGIGADGLTQLAYEKAQQNPDWAEWQAVGTYAPALFEALGATVPGVGS